MKEQQKKMEIQHCLCSMLKKGNSLLCSWCTNEQSCVDKYVVIHTEWQVQSSCPFKTISNGNDKIIKFLSSTMVTFWDAVQDMLFNIRINETHLTDPAYG